MSGHAAIAEGNGKIFDNSSDLGVMTSQDSVDKFKVPMYDDKGNFKASARTKTGVINMVGHFVAYGRLTANIQSPSCMYSFDASN